MPTVFRFFLAAAFCCFWLAPSGASGAPFCVEAEGVPSECWYYDARLCKEEAFKRSGRCSANLQEISLPKEGQPVCILGSGLVPICSYRSMDDCNNQAANRNAVCFQKADSDDMPDPYRFDRPSFDY